MGFLHDMAEVGRILRDSDEKTVPPQWHMQASTAKMKKMLIVRLSKDGILLDMNVEREKSKKEEDDEPQEEIRIFYPVSEESISRTSKGAINRPHPLCDDYKYVFGKGIRNYLANLKDWIDASEESDATTFLNAVKTYVENGSVAVDVETYLSKKDAKDAKDSFVLWRVDGIGDCRNCPLISESWISYYSEKRRSEIKNAFDMITGETGIKRSVAAKGLTVTAQNRKWFSFPAKDELRWKGRFDNEDELLSITDETADLIETGMKYLFGNKYMILPTGKEDENGRKIYASKGRSLVLRNGEVVAAWSMTDVKITLEEAEDGFDAPVEEITVRKVIDEGKLISDKLTGADAVDAEAKNIRVAVLGGLTSGRLSLDAYFDYESYSSFTDTIRKWTEFCSWEKLVRKIENGNVKYEYAKFVPNVRRLIETLLGDYDKSTGTFSMRNSKLLESVERETVLARLSGRKVPTTLVNAAKRRPNRLVTFMDANNGKSNAGNVLTVSLAVLRKHYKDSYGKEFGMDLDGSNESRDYLYGRLLAAYHATEEDFFTRKKIKGRITDALKYQETFAKKPASIAKRLDEKKSLWFRCEGMETKWMPIIGEIIEKIEETEKENERTKEKSLSPEYLFGFYAELKALKGNRRII